MIRNLLIISGVGLVLAVVGIGGSLSLGGADLARHSWVWAIKDDDHGGINITRTVNDGEVAPQSTRQIAWDGTERLGISLPGDVLYIQNGNAPGISLTGPQELIDRVTFANGQLVLASRSNDNTAYVGIGKNGISGWNDSDQLKITINAASVKTFELQGSTDLEVRAYNQPTLNVLLTGSADIEVQGRTETLTVDASGSSSAELDELVGTDANIRVSGNADVTTAANGVVIVDGSGNGSVRLMRNVAELRQTLSGNAEVSQD